MSGSRYSTLTTLYDRNYDFVNIQNWIFRISADDLVPRFISFNDFQWISTAKFVWKRQIFEYFEFFLTKDYWDRMSSQYVTCHESRHYSCHTTIQSHNKWLGKRMRIYRWRQWAYIYHAKLSFTWENISFITL